MGGGREVLSHNANHSRDALAPELCNERHDSFCLRIKGGEAPKGASSLEPRHTSKRRRLNVNRRQVYAVCVTYLLTRQRAYRSPLAFRRSAAAWEAIHVLLKRSPAPPPVYQGQFDPKALLNALKVFIFP